MKGKKWRNLWCVILTVVMLAGMLSGCGGGGTAQTDDGQTVSQDQSSEK